MTIKLRSMIIDDLKKYEEMNHPDRLFHEFNGPYFKRESLKELQDRIKRMYNVFNSGKPVKNHCKMIVDASNDDLIGEVSWYWKSEETKWLEIGVVIFNETYWGRGIGYKAMSLWIDHVFTIFPDLVRIGLTTWSGNERMIKLSEKLGMRQEACFRMARTYNGEYYDSVSYGILKSEWSMSR